MLEKVDDFGAPERALAHVQEQAPVVGEAANHREMIARTGDPEERGLAPRRVGAHQAREQIEAGFIYPDNRAPLALGFA